MEKECIPVFNFFGFPLRAETMKQAVHAITARVRDRQQTIHASINAFKVSMAERSPAFRDLLKQFDILHADGASVVIASRLLGHPLPERIAGIDLMRELLQVSSREKFGVYLLGGRSDVLQAAQRKIKQKYPAVCIVGARHGYWHPGEERCVVTDVRNSGADLLFVGLPSPMKEEFLYRWRHSLGVTFCMGVGGAFDIFAGVVKRAPQSWQKAGMEWAYRLIQEPRKMWKRNLVTNTHFLWILFRELMRSYRAR